MYVAYKMIHLATLSIAYCTDIGKLSLISGKACGCSILYTMHAMMFTTQFYTKYRLIATVADRRIFEYPTTTFEGYAITAC